MLQPHGLDSFVCPGALEICCVTKLWGEWVKVDAEGPFWFPSSSTVSCIQVQPVTKLLGWNTDLSDSCAHQQTTSLNLIKMSFLCLISHLLALIKTISLCIPGGPNFLWVPSAGFSPFTTSARKIQHLKYYLHSQFGRDSSRCFPEAFPERPAEITSSSRGCEKCVLRLCLLSQIVFKDSINASFPLGCDNFHGWVGFGGCHAQTGCRAVLGYLISGIPRLAEEQVVLGLLSSLAFARQFLICAALVFEP